MASAFVDTNIFLRYITQPDPTQPHLVRQTQQARAIFTSINTGALSATTCEGVVVEVVWVLSSKTLYNVPRVDIQRLLSPLLRLPGLALTHKRSYLRALDLYVQHPFLDFVDALQVAHMERQRMTDILSFDRDFDRIPQVSRLEG